MNVGLPYRSPLALAVDSGCLDEFILEFPYAFWVVFGIEMDSNAVDHPVCQR